jgi:membrane protein implicated in regulation of membrane protease activity
MTLRDLVQLIGERPLPLAILLGTPPLVAWLTGYFHPREGGGTAPWKYVYALLVYLVSLPGMFAAVLTGYALFVRNDNLLDVNALVYILPIVSMILTLFFIRQNVDFDRVPGFDRLSGLMVMIAVSFALALAIQRTRIWLFFGGSVQTLFFLALGLFALLKWGAYAFFRRRDQPRIEPPSLRLS